MPLVKRSVTPSSLCRQKLPKNIGSELECVTNNTLSGVIMQLSSLSHHAEDVFGELFTEANSFYSRANTLQDRIDRLSVKVTQLDSTIEEVSLHDINMRKAFRSSGTTDQQVVSRESLPATLIETYNQADKPPPLQDLNQFRDDDRDALKIYTDPDYFFNLWREAMQKEMREAKEKRREQRKRERRANPGFRQNQPVRKAIPKSRLKAQQMQQGVEFIESNSPQINHVQKEAPATNSPSPESYTMTPPPPPQSDGFPSPDDGYMKNSQSSPLPPYITDNPPPYFPDGPPPVDYPPPPPTGLPAPPSPPPMNGGIPPNPNIPPPPPPVLGGNAPPPPPPPSSGSNIPPPPPPPSMPAASGLAGALQGVTLKRAADNPAPAPVEDSRSGLLKAIRVGINLKKVEQQEKTAATSSGGGNDVASILARRIAVEFSDSESDSFTDDDGDWE